MRSIALKMGLAFLAIALISIVLIVLLARWNTGTEFSRFISDRRGADQVNSLAEYYRTHGSWEAVSLTDSASDQPARPGGNGPPRESFFTLADTNGLVVVPGPDYFPGQQVPQMELDQGLPIQVEGETVGTLVFGRIPLERNPREEEFIRRTNLMLIYSALAVSLVAVLVGIFLSRTLTRPIRELTEATQAVASGNLGLQVSVRSRDEMGKLAASFNKMSADLARSTEARKQMTADIAHELRTPLSLILGHAEAVHDDVLPPSGENFEIIREEAGRLDHLVEDLRTLSLADAGELSMHFQGVKPRKLLKDLEASFQHLASQKDIQIRLETDSDLPNLTLDPGRMTQVLSNLLKNALQHTPAGGQILLAARNVPESVELSIMDTGPGVEGQEIEHIFDRFYRADKARNREAGGSGLGLAIAKSIVQAHDGQILAESAPGQGLCVKIKFPIKPNS